ncbi:MAG: hypothetical protein IH831_02690 [Planctomycetes bacterium]|nr:hypothetical protein [Planctomycetota bacterium]
MSSLPVFVGLDYHQDSVQVCVLDQQGKQLCNRSVSNDARTIQRVATRHGSPRRIAIEACCGAADLAEELVTQRGKPKNVVVAAVADRWVQWLHHELRRETSI